MLNPLRGKSLKLQLVIYLMASVALLVTCFSLSINYLARERSEAMTLQNAQQLAASLANSAVFGLLTDSPANIEADIQQLIDFPDVAGVGVINNEGEFLIWRGDLRGQSYFQTFRWRSPDEIMYFNETKSFWHLVMPVVIEEDPSLDDPMSLDVPVTELGFAVVTYSKKGMQSFNQSVVTTLIVTSIIFALVVLFILLVGAEQVLKPMQMVSDAMTVARTSDAFTKIDEDGSPEIQRIAKAFNGMMTAMQFRDEQLRNYAQKLQAEVEIRIRELQQARSAALIASKHKSEFVANVSHELRSPLNSIMGYIDKAEKEVKAASMFELAEDLTRAQRAARRLMIQVNQMLELSAIEANKSMLDRQPVALNKVLEATQEAVQPLVSVNNNTFKIVGLDGVNPTINVDDEKLIQVLINLLSNACKFTHNGNIVLRVSLVDYQLQFVVSDTGVGIPEADLDFIFQPFSQADMGSNRQFQGTGLGLAISQQFCEMMGATMSVSSQVGCGSEFTVSVPLEK